MEEICSGLRYAYVRDNIIFLSYLYTLWNFEGFSFCADFVIWISGIYRNLYRNLSPYRNLLPIEIHRTFHSPTVLIMPFYLLT